MQLDDMQNSWRAQDARIDEILKIGRSLKREAALRAPRKAIYWFKAATVIEIGLGLLCLIWSGSFIYADADEVHLAAMAACLHLWLIGTAMVALARLIRAREIDYGAAVVQIQRQIEQLRVFTVRSVRALFVVGVPIWTIAFPLMLIRSGFGANLAATLSVPILASAFVLGAAIAYAALELVDALMKQGNLPARLQHALRSLSGRGLLLAQDQLAKLAAFERAD